MSQRIIFGVTISFMVLFISCATNNNLFLSDATPLSKDSSKVFIGIGESSILGIDSVKANKEVVVGEKLRPYPLLSVGTKYGISKQTTVSGQLYFPFLIAGAGLKLGIQHSFFKKNSDFNIALGVDAGGSLSKDSITLFGQKNPTETFNKGVFFGNVYVPITIKIFNGCKLHITPRYCLNSFSINKYDSNNSVSRFYSANYPLLTLGLQYKRVYFESSSIYFLKNVIPNFGIAIFY